MWALIRLRSRISSRNRLLASIGPGLPSRRRAKWAAVASASNRRKSSFSADEVAGGAAVLGHQHGRRGAEVARQPVDHRRELGALALLRQTTPRFRRLAAETSRLRSSTSPACSRLVVKHDDLLQPAMVGFGEAVGVERGQIGLDGGVEPVEHVVEALGLARSACGRRCRARSSRRAASRPARRPCAAPRGRRRRGRSRASPAPPRRDRAAATDRRADAVRQDAAQQCWRTGRARGRTAAPGEVEHVWKSATARAGSGRSVTSRRPIGSSRARPTRTPRTRLSRLPSGSRLPAASLAGRALEQRVDRRARDWPRAPARRRLPAAPRPWRRAT